MSVGATATISYFATTWAQTMRSVRPTAPPIEAIDGLLERYLGEVCAGAEVSEEFRFRNVGDEPLKVADVSTSCGCTRYMIVPNELAPGAIGSLLVTTVFEDRYGNEQSTGIRADIQFVDYVSPVTVACDVLVVRALPAVVDFGRVLPGSASQTALFLARNCGRAPDYTAITSDHPAVTARFVPCEREPDARRVEVTLEPPAAPGLLVGRLILHNDDGGQSPAVVIRAQVAARVECDPPTLLLGTIAPGRRYSYVVRVASQVDHAFEIEGIQTNVPGLTCEWGPTDLRQREYLVRLTLAQPDVQGAIGGTLVIALSDPQCPAALVPVYGQCMTEAVSAPSAGGTP